MDMETVQHDNPLFHHKMAKYPCVCGSKIKMKKCCGRMPYLNGRDVIQVNMWINKYKNKMKNQISDYVSKGNSSDKTN